MLYRSQKSRLVNVLVATPGGGGGQGGIDRVMALLRDEALRQGRDDLRLTLGATRGGGSILFSPLYLAGFCARMVAMRLSGRLDVVHINLASDGSTRRKLVVAGLARRLGVPYVLHLHGGNYPNFWIADGSRLSRAIARMFAGAARVIVLGRIWRDFVVSRVPALVDRISVLPNATPRPSLPHVGGGDSIHILFLGRINDMKGVPQLGEALNRMKSLPGWRATIAGDGNVEAARQKSAEYGFGDRVSLPGWVDGQRVAALIAGADILVLPSFIENLPLSIIEGMASGLAIVATPVGAVEDIVADGVTGLLVQPGDVDALTGALTRLVSEPELRRRLGQAAEAVHRERLDITPYTEAMTGIWAAAAR